MLRHPDLLVAAPPRSATCRRARDRREHCGQAASACTKRRTSGYATRRGIWSAVRRAFSKCASASCQALSAAAAIPSRPLDQSLVPQDHIAFGHRQGEKFVSARRRNQRPRRARSPPGNACLYLSRRFACFAGSNLFLMIAVCSKRSIALLISGPRIRSKQKLFENAFTQSKSMKTTTSHRRISARTTKTSRISGNGNGRAPAKRPELAISPRVTSWLAKPKQNLIGGKWVSAASHKTFDVFNPAEGSVIARVAAATDAKRRPGFQTKSPRRLLPR